MIDMPTTFFTSLNYDCRVHILRYATTNSCDTDSLLNLELFVNDESPLFLEVCSLFTHLHIDCHHVTLLTGSAPWGKVSALENRVPGSSINNLKWNWEENYIRIHHHDNYAAVEVISRIGFALVSISLSDAHERIESRLLEPVIHSILQSCKNIRGIKLNLSSGRQYIWKTLVYHFADTLETLEFNSMSIRAYLLPLARIFGL